MAGLPRRIIKVKLFNIFNSIIIVFYCATIIIFVFMAWNDIGDSASYG